MIWQTKHWGKMLINSNQASKIFNVGGVSVEKRSIGLGQYGLFVIGLDYSLDCIGGNTEKTENHLIQLCKEERALFVQIEMITYSGIIEKQSCDFSHFTLGSYKRFIFQYSVMIDLTKSEDEILTGMKQKGRYNIKQAIKKELIVKTMESTLDNITLFHDLIKTTTTRNNFNGNTLDYYKTFLDTITDSQLLFVYHGEKVIAGGIFIFQDDISYYYYGVSTSNREERKLMAPYLLQWEAIKIAKEKGSKIYDFFGVAPEGSTGHSLQGVTDFKRKFSNDVIQVSEQYIHVERKIFYTIMLLLKKINLLIKGIKSRLKK